MKYDVFVFELCEGNISKQNFRRASRNESISVCDQLLEVLIELENSNSCHNDLKPENVLFKYDQNGDLHIRISGFEAASRSGGTPGWTLPKFLSERKPGKGDCYSIALLMMYTMCDDEKVFYRIRNNHVESRGQQWLASFRQDPFFKLIIDMMNLKLTPIEAKDRWDQISGRVQIITKENLCKTFGIDSLSLRQQDRMNIVQKDSTLSKTKTKKILTIETQGDTMFCWLFSLSRSLVNSMRMTAGQFVSYQVVAIN